MMNGSTRPIDTKREEYRKYLERTGVMDAIAKTLTQLYEEQNKPTDALGFVYKFFGESFPDRVPRVGDLESDLAEARNKIQKLTEEVEELKTKLTAAESAKAISVEDEVMLEDPPEVPPPAPTVPSTEVPDVVTAPEPEAVPTPAEEVVAPPSEDKTPAPVS